MATPKEFKTVVAVLIPSALPCTAPGGRARIDRGDGQRFTTH